jgi:hypothetical protein
MRQGSRLCSVCDCTGKARRVTRWFCRQVFKEEDAVLFISSFSRGLLKMSLCQELLKLGRINHNRE